MLELVEGWSAWATSLCPPVPDERNLVLSYMDAEVFGAISFSASMLPHVPWNIVNRVFFLAPAEDPSVYLSPSQP